MSTSELVCSRKPRLDVYTLQWIKSILKGSLRWEPETSAHQLKGSITCEKWEMSAPGGWILESWPTLSAPSTADGWWSFCTLGPVSYCTLNCGHLLLGPAVTWELQTERRDFTKNRWEHETDSERSVGAAGEERFGDGSRAWWELWPLHSFSERPWPAVSESWRRWNNHFHCFRPVYSLFVGPQWR